DHHRAQLLGLLRRSVDGVDTDVGQPVRWRTRDRVTHHAAPGAAPHVDHRVSSAGNRHVLQLPAEEIRVKLARAPGIVRLQLHVDEGIRHDHLLPPSVPALISRVHLELAPSRTAATRAGGLFLSPAATFSSPDTTWNPRRYLRAPPSRRSHTVCSRESSCRHPAEAPARAPSVS